MAQGGEIGQLHFTTQFGSLKEFDPEQESITAYLERAELFFTANSIEDNKKTPVFLSIVGAKTYGLLQNLLALDLPQTKNMAESSFRTETISHHAEIPFSPQEPTSHRIYCGICGRVEEVVYLL